MSQAQRKVAVVTGANKGIGFAIVKGLCERYNGTVYLTARDTRRGEAAVQQLKNLGLNPVFHKLNVTSKESIKTLKDDIVREHGGIDLLINNAGVYYELDGEYTIKVNYFGILDISNELFPILRQNARVVHLSSALGLLHHIPSASIRSQFTNANLTVPKLSELMNQYVQALKNGTAFKEGWGNSSYAVSKVAVSALTVVQQRDLNNERPLRNISVNCCHPGYVNTDLTGHRGILSPTEGARSALYLALENHNLKGKFVWQDTTVVDWTTA